MSRSFIVLHSSAGAGKTHALVKNYLQRCLAQEAPSTYRHVLALTFTNKAATEMRERVLGYLEKLADGSQEAVIASLRADLMAELAIAEGTVQQRASRTLHHMLHHWSDVAIGTIDAFTRRVVQPFARDLRLDHELRMTTDQDHYRDAAIDLLLTEAGGSPALTELLVATCRGLIEDEQAWRVDKPLRQLSAQLDKEQSLAHLQALRGLGNGMFLELEQRLRDRIRSFTAQVRALGNEALSALETAGITEKDMAYGRGGPIGHLRKIARFERTLDAPGSNTEKALGSGKWHSASASPEARATLDSLAPKLSHAIQEVERMRPQLRAHTIACAVLRDLMPAATLHLLDEALEELKRTEGVAFFSDLTRKVAAIVRDEPAPFIFERLGERYRHFLIDEFQDTSLLQWQCLLPLVENALSEDGSVVLVGDAKQAIYRWRNGEVRQFIDLPRLFRKEDLPNGEALEHALAAHYTAGERLAHNRRSARAIIDFNNRLFGALKAVLPERLRGAYAEHEQEPHKQQEGLVSLLPLVEQEEEGPPTHADLTVRCVKEALEDGFAPGDIAILVRGKKAGAEVTAHLVKEGHRVISPDGLRLGGDPVSELVINVMGFLLHRDDAHAAKALQYMAIANATTAEVDPFGGTSESTSPRAQLQRWLSAHPDIGLRMPLTELVTRIIEASGRMPVSDGYLLFLLDEAHTFSLEHGPDLAGFLAHWDRKGSDRAVELPPDRSAIRVMTIHAAKGLQFPVVIVPISDMHGRGNHREMLWIAPGEAVPGLPSALVRLDPKLKDQGVPEVDEEQELSLFDELNLLYVAFTRPEARLYAGIGMKSSATLAAALRGCLGDPPEGPWTFGHRELRTAATHEQPGLMTATARSPWQDRLRLRKEAPEEWDPTAPDPDRARGHAVHALLAAVMAPEDLQPALQRMVDSGELEEQEAGELRAKLTRMFTITGMDAFFAPDLRLRNEATLIDASGHAHRPDRVVFTENATRVLDIKTGVPRDTHREQVTRYVSLLRALGHPNVSGHLLYTRTGELIPVDE